MQEFGLQLLMLDEQRDERDAFVERFKLALVAHDPPHFIPKVFPELLGGKPEPAVAPDAVEVEVAPDEDLSDTVGAWRFTDTPTPEEAEALMAQFMSVPNGHLAMADIGGDGDEEPW